MTPAHPFLSLMLLLLAGVPALAEQAREEAYRWVDAHGVTVFSDRPRPSAAGSGAEKIRLGRSFIPDTVIPEYCASCRAPAPASPDTGEMPSASMPDTGYEVGILSPADGAAVRENSGALTLQLGIRPNLAPGHSAQLMMDGRSIRSLNGSGPVHLAGLDRGAHSFSIRILDENGKLLQTTPDLSIFMLRHARPR